MSLGSAVSDQLLHLALVIITALVVPAGWQFLRRGPRLRPRATAVGRPSAGLPELAAVGLLVLLVWPVLVALRQLWPYPELGRPATAVVVAIAVIAAVGWWRARPGGA